MPGYSSAPTESSPSAKQAFSAVFSGGVIGAIFVAIANSLPQPYRAICFTIAPSVGAFATVCVPHISPFLLNHIRVRFVRFSVHRLRVYVQAEKSRLSDPFLAEDEKDRIQENINAINRMITDSTFQLTQQDTTVLHNSRESDMKPDPTNDSCLYL